MTKTSESSPHRTSVRNRESDTDVRILEAAARLFGEHGYHGVSIRMIVREAGIHISSLYHRYESKADLLEAVFRWYVEPMRQERQALLAEYLKSHGNDQRHDTKMLLKVMIGPAIHLSQKSDSRHIASRLAGFFGTDPSLDVKSVIASIYDEEMTTLMGMIRSAAPTISESSFFWATCAIYGTLIYLQSDLHRVREILSMDTPYDDRKAIDSIAEFLESGLKQLET